MKLSLFPKSDLSSLITVSTVDRDIGERIGVVLFVISVYEGGTKFVLHATKRQRWQSNCRCGQRWICEDNASSHHEAVKIFAK
jgi:hypothetical protein